MSRSARYTEHDFGRISPYNTVKMADGDTDPINAAVWVFFAGLVAIILIVYPFLKRKGSNGGARREVDARAPAAVAPRVGGARRNRNMRAQAETARRLQMQAVADYLDEDWSDEEGPPEEMMEPDDDDQLPTGKIGTKKMKRLQAKIEKKAQREQEEALREDRKRREALREEELKKADEKQKKLEEKQAEEARLAKEEQERRELEEYLRLKEFMEVEEEGEGGGATEEDSQALLQEFIDYIKENKVVELDDLASQFNLRTQEAIDRIHQLQEMSRLTGVIDDRGKFIYISQEEMEAVAGFIKQQGRVSIQDLASASSRLVHLQHTRSTAVHQWAAP